MFDVKRNRNRNAPIIIIDMVWSCARVCLVSIHLAKLMQIQMLGQTEIKWFCFRSFSDAFLGFVEIDSVLWYYSQYSPFFKCHSHIRTNNETVSICGSVPTSHRCKKNHCFYSCGLISLESLLSYRLFHSHCWTLWKFPFSYGIYQQFLWESAKNRICRSNEIHLRFMIRKQQKIYLIIWPSSPYNNNWSSLLPLSSFYWRCSNSFL